MFEVELSVIVALETFHWYNIRGISKELFDKDLEAIKARIMLLKPEDIYEITNNAKKSKLQFKLHAIDIIIGIQALLSNSTLITYNLRHFKWMGSKNILTPEQLVLLEQTKGK